MSVRHSVPTDTSPALYLESQMNNASFKSASLKRQIFRPALNGLEVIEIAAIQKRYAPLSDVCKKFAIQEFKITQGVSDPSYIKEVSIEERLESVPIHALDKKLSQKEAYDKWIISAEACTLAELADVMQYKYINDLMSPSEEKEYELSQGVNFS